MSNCAVCHGSLPDEERSIGIRSLPGELDFSPPSLGVGLPRDVLIEVISQGRPGTPMSSWANRLGRQRIEALADFILGRSDAEKTSAATAKPDHPGARLYRKRCAACHAEDGAGTEWAKASLSTSPTDFTNARVIERFNRDRLVFSTVNGRPGTAMTAYSGQMSDSEIGSVVDYILELMKRAVQRSEPASGPEVLGADDLVDVSSEAELIPDLPRGAEIYRRYCHDCHGTEGQGDGPRARLSMPPPGSLVGMPGATRDSVMTAVNDGVKGTSMPAWAAVLSRQEVIDVSEYVVVSLVLADGN